MNLDLGKGWLVEVQLMFASVLTIKKELHNFYDIVRAKDYYTILSPIFEKAQTNEGRVKEELKKSNQTFNSVKNAERMNQRLSFINLDGGDGGGEENKRLKEKNRQLEARLERLESFIREKMITEEEAETILGM
ncbi:hypothetical protein TrVE_jg98 [Triparma verrucosa]|uniref:Uncharacterized protein n=1 Tax=Triparma verrucosa TaxID=1606542 RepID=A0A9W7FDR6_9STRA|nr:hypothetical protein TrVE_jg98 [Triparma verrucosa]